ncbi:hypothetical protein GCM10020220_002930 [Nonomuraea rubra]
MEKVSERFGAAAVAAADGMARPGVMDKSSAPSVPIIHPRRRARAPRSSRVAMKRMVL